MIRLPSPITGPLFGYDLETKDTNLKTLGPGWAFNDSGYPVGYALAWFDGDVESLTRKDLLNHEIEPRFQSVYLPVRHEGGGNFPMDQVRPIVQPLLLDKSRTAIGANIIYDYGWTRWDGFQWECDLDDVQIQAPLLDDARRSYSLDSLLRDRLGLAKSEARLRQAAEQFGLKNVKEQLWKLPAAFVEEYARDDAARTLWLYLFQRFDIRDSDLEVVARVERDLVPVLYAMRKRGVRINEQRVQAMREHFLRLENTAAEKLRALSGRTIDPWAATPIIDSLMEHGVSEGDFPLTPKKREKSVDNVFLKGLSKSDNTAGHIAKQVLTLRRYNKARSTFVEGMIMGHLVNGRIHGELRALRGDDGGTVSGRLSGSNPSLQVVPARDPELGPLVRSAFEPEEGDQWASIDYSSQEPRLATHFGVKANIPGSEVMYRVWNENPRADAYLQTAELCGLKRKDAKTIKLGILYGMGGGTLCASLGLPFTTKFWKGKEIMVAGPEGEELLERFHSAAPMDKALAEAAQTAAKRRGYVKTLLGRRAYFPRQANGQIWFTHKALNRVIQGSAADMTKVAMINCHRAGFTPLVSVHDELGFSVSDRGQAEQIAQIMSSATELAVPVVCDVELGTSWGDSMLRGEEGEFWTEDSLADWGMED
jgi:DNA polymerase I-like protein with 3'-5' exonuclease and polymerase domains